MPDAYPTLPDRFGTARETGPDGEPTGRWLVGERAVDGAGLLKAKAVKTGAVARRMALSENCNIVGVYENWQVYNVGRDGTDLFIGRSPTSDVSQADLFVQMIEKMAEGSAAHREALLLVRRHNPHQWARIEMVGRELRPQAFACLPGARGGWTQMTSQECAYLHDLLSERGDDLARGIRERLDAVAFAEGRLGIQARAAVVSKFGRKLGEDEVDFQCDGLVSPGEDGGAYVMAFLWVDEDELEAAAGLEDDVESPAM